MRIVSRIRAVAAMCVAGAVVVLVPAAAQAALTAPSTAARPSVTGVANVKDGAPSGGMRGGAVVTISGRNFVKHHTSVTVGGKRVRSLSVLSATTLRVRVPAHPPAIVAVRVRTRAGVSAFTSRDRFLYQDRQTLSTGAGFSCQVLTSTETAQCWGENDFGVLGDGTTTSSATPVQVTGLTQVVSIEVADAHACALTAAGTVFCWGDRQGGALGDGPDTGTGRTNSTPVQVHDLGRVVALAQGLGYRDSCAIVYGGKVTCWGLGHDGQLGNGTKDKNLTPGFVSGLTSAVSVGVGPGFTCATTARGSEFCWGSDDKGQLGIGTMSEKDSTRPVQVLGVTQAVDTAVGDSHACILDRSGHARCWGRNQWGQLGTGTTTLPVARPQSVHGGRRFTKISAGVLYTCGLSGGQAFCWGYNRHGSLGDGTTTNRATPTRVAGGLTRLTTISAGAVSSLAARGDGTAWAWGDGTTTPVPAG